MIKNKRTRKTIAIFLYIISVIWKVQGQGPITPEASSFEPVDASDLVNLLSGDFTYVLPLIEVPSPEGGYPLALSYHAGIAADQEATWVGLGWNVNPGVINRSVSGFPDDWKEARLSSITYDIGGTITNHNFSIGIGWGEGKYSAGLYASYSENKAFGGETTYNFDIGGQYGKEGGISGKLGTSGIGFGSNLKTISSSGCSGYVAVGIGYSFKTGGTTFSISGKAKSESTGTDTGKNAKTNSSGSIGLDQNISFGGSNKGNHGGVYSMTPDGFSLGINLNIFLLNINYRLIRLIEVI